MSEHPKIWIYEYIFVTLISRRGRFSRKFMEEHLQYAQIDTLRGPLVFPKTAY